MTDNEEGPRFWVYEDLPPLDVVPRNWHGLVDEVEGGMIAYGPPHHIGNLMALLNRLPAGDPERVVYITIPVRFASDGTVAVDLTDDGTPGDWGNLSEYDPVTESHEWRNATEEEWGVAWDLVAGALKREE